MDWEGDLMPGDAAIEAGAQVILDNLGTCNPGTLFDPRKVAEEVYAAMVAFEPKPKVMSPFILKLDTSELQAALAEFTAGIAEFKAAVEAATAEDTEPNRG
jgi:hypothetical protein